MRYRERLLELINLTLLHREKHSHATLAHAMACQAMKECDKRQATRTIQFVRKCHSALLNYVKLGVLDPVDGDESTSIYRAIRHASALSSTSALIYIRWLWRCQYLVTAYGQTISATIT